MELLRLATSGRRLGRHQADGSAGEIRDHADRHSKSPIIVVWVVRDHRQAADSQEEAENHEG
jgi:hypothetical protein